MIFVLLILTSSFYESLSVADEKNYWAALGDELPGNTHYVSDTLKRYRRDFKFHYFCDCNLETLSCEYSVDYGKDAEPTESHKLSKALGKKNRLLLSGQSHRDGNWTTNVIFEQPGRRMESKIVRGIQPLVTLLKNDPKLSKLKGIVNQIQYKLQETKTFLSNFTLVAYFTTGSRRIIMEVEQVETIFGLDLFSRIFVMNMIASCLFVMTPLCYTFFCSNSSSLRK